MNSFAWVLILLYTANFVSSFAHEDSEMLRSKDFLISSEKLPLSDVQEHGKVMALENIKLTEKAQRGKGAYGGADIVHRPPERSAAAVLQRPCLFLCSTIVGFRFLSFLLQ